MELNLASAFSAVAAAALERDCIVFRDRRLSYADVDERTNRFANFLLDRGITAPEARSTLAGWQSGQDHVALYLYNGNEYLEATVGAYKARAVPANVNYRYVESELRYLFSDLRPKVVVYGATFAPVLAAVLPDLPAIDVLVHVDDGSSNAPLPGATEYEHALASSSPLRPPTEPSPDDLYMLYTGGTTGMPKGVLWRQADVMVAALGARNAVTDTDWTSLDDLAAAARATGGPGVLPAPPFMHGAAHWMALNGFLLGRTIVIQDTVERLDPADVWRCVEREKVRFLLIVGDAFARPLVEELERGDYDVSSLAVVVTGGAVTNSGLKTRLVQCVPGLRIVDTGGASETGAQISHVSSADIEVSTGVFTPLDGTCVIADDRTTVLAPGHDGIGWLARRGRVPLGYLGDPDKTAATFPVVDRQRWAVPGDRARHRADGMIELLGRESVTINSGGEKIFAEEVEQVLIDHAAIYDAVVVGRPSERWGEEVVAVVQLRDGADVTDEELIGHCARVLARFKLPKAIVRRSLIVRSPAGKADYRWARDVASNGLLHREL